MSKTAEKSRGLAQRPNSVLRVFSLTLLSLIMFFPILRISQLSLLLTLFFITGVIFSLKTILTTILDTSIRHLLISSGFFVLLLISFFYSFNKDYAQIVLLRQISLFCFPLIFFYGFKLTRQEIFLMCKLFVLANALVAIFFIFILTKSEQGIDIISNRLLITNITAKDWHPTYVSTFFLASLFFTIASLFSSKGLPFFLLSLLVGLFLCAILLLGSRIIVYLMLTLVPLYVFIKLKTLRIKGVFVLSFFALMIGFGYFVSSNHSLEFRLINHLNSLFKRIVLDDLAVSGLDMRYFINQCNSELFLRNPIFGVGVGDVQYSLNNCYLDKEFFTLYESEFNSHNTYFYLLLSGGLVTFLSFLGALAYTIFMYWKRRNILAIFLILSLLVVFLTENFLVRINGIVFFSILSSLLYYAEFLISNHVSKE